MAENENQATDSEHSKKDFERFIEKKDVTILGIPIDNRSIEDIVEALFVYIDHPLKKQVPTFISTVNVNFLNNAYSWFSSIPRLPELVRILRNSTIATADGMPIVWLSHWLGYPLKMRVTGVDLFNRICEECQKKNKSIFILGGETNTTQKAIESLEETYPQLKIVGTYSPHIIVKGDKLANSFKDNVDLVERINKVSPDILILCLGNPKQEIWFSRIQHLLTVPLSIGIGGTLKFIAKETTRAPLWMQNSGLEWFYRLLVEPKHLWKRYSINIVKFSFLALPVLSVTSFLKLLSLWPSTPSKLEMHPFRIDSKQWTIFKLPSLIDKNSIPELEKAILHLFEFSTVILDFKEVNYLSLEGISFLTKCLLAAKEYHKQWKIIHVSSILRSLFKAHKIWDLVMPLSIPYAESYFQTLSENEKIPNFSIGVSKETALISILGVLKNTMDYSYFRREATAALAGKDCFIDLDYCTEIESGGFAFLLQLRNIQISQRRLFKVSTPSSKLQQQMKIAKVDKLFDP